MLSPQAGEVLCCKQCNQRLRNLLRSFSAWINSPKNAQNADRCSGFVEQNSQQRLKESGELRRAQILQLKIPHFTLFHWEQHSSTTSHYRIFRELRNPRIVGSVGGQKDRWLVQKALRLKARDVINKEIFSPRSSTSNAPISRAPSNRYRPWSLSIDLVLVRSRNTENTPSRSFASTR